MWKMTEFKVGEYIIYVNGDRYELGRIKRLTEDGAFICYHEGETAAKTPYDLIHKIVNGFTIKETTIGGETFNKMSNLEKAKEIIKANYTNAEHGIFNSRNNVGDAMSTIYEDECLTIDICYGYEYFEVFGLSDAEFEELERYYDSL